MIDKLQKTLQKGEAVLITEPKNRRYYTGMNTSNGALLITNDDAAFFTDFRYISAAKKNVYKQIKTELFLSSRAETIKKFLENKDCKKIYFEENSLSYSEVSNLKKALPEYDLEEGESNIFSFRQIKNNEEIESIKKAQKIADNAFLFICDYIKANKSKNLTEKMIALELEFEMRRCGSGAMPFSIIIASGKNSALPHAVPSDKIIESGDFITMDYGASVNDYVSDMTRTVAIDFVSDKQRLVYETVLTAQKTALLNIKAGLSGRDCDAFARDIIANAGFGEYFGHSLGHSVGLYIHESPNFSPSFTGLIPAGAVMSVEPGIYIEGEFGVRIEDLVVVKEDGIENLTHSEKELIIL